MLLQLDDLVFGENSMGGATAIGVGNAEDKDDGDEDGPRTPPWESKDSLLVPIENSQPPQLEPQHNQPSKLNLLGLHHSQISR